MKKARVSADEKRHRAVEYLMEQVGLCSPIHLLRFMDPKHEYLGLYTPNP